MSDEEPFIRAIVDSPGDETPRMVYADWLEERGDPRGAYLQAEQQAVRTGDTSKMEELAAGLDPVWVARVTLPPLGVCCEHVQIEDRGPPIDARDIEQFEQRLGITLPPDYRAFLLNYNGGVVESYPLETPDGKPIPSGHEHKFYALKPLPQDRKRSWLEQSLSFQERYLAQVRPALDFEHWFLQFIDIGRSPDWIHGILLRVAGPGLGQVIYFDYSGEYGYGQFNDDMEPDATSFAGFLSTLPW